MLLSSKITHSVLNFLESKDLDAEILYSSVNTPEEFLKDPFSWQSAQSVEFFLEKFQSLFSHTIPLSSNIPLIQHVGHECVHLQAWGPLDDVIKMIRHPQQFYVKPANLLSYFISPTPHLTKIKTDHQKQKNNNSFHLSFCLDLSANDYPHFALYLKAALEALPTYIHHNMAEVSWEDKTIRVVWQNQQASFFENHKTNQIKDVGLMEDPLVKKLIHSLEKAQKDLAKYKKLTSKDKSFTKQLHLSQSDPDLKQQKHLQEMETWNHLIHQVAYEAHPYILKSLNNTQKLRDYFIRVKQVLTVLSTYKQCEPYIKNSMKQAQWDFISQEFLSVSQDSIQALLKVNEILERLTQKASDLEKLK